MSSAHWRNVAAEKALIAIGKQQARDNCLRMLEAMGGMLKIDNLGGEAGLASHFDAVPGNLNDAMLNRRITLDYTNVFERYIHNNAPPPR